MYNEGLLSEITYKYDIKNVVFKLKIGKNLKEVGNAELCDYFPKADNKGNITLYHPVLYVECSKAVSYTHLDVYKRQGYSTFKGKKI